MALILKHRFRNFPKFFRYYCLSNKIKYPLIPKNYGLDSKVALITGGGSGIGAAIAKVFLEHGVAALIIADNNINEATTTISKLTEQYGADKVVFYETDVSEPEEFFDVFKKAVDNYNKIDIVVNNAGIMNDIQWPRQLNINLNSTVLGTLLGLQYMSRTSQGKGGTIINISSIMGLIPSISFPIHTMTQFGIVGFTRAIGAHQHFERTGVRVINICPGLTNTNLLKNGEKNTINEYFAHEFKQETANCIVQSAEWFAGAVGDILNKASSGSVWVVDSNLRPYEIKFPDSNEFRFKISS